MRPFLLQHQESEAAWDPVRAPFGLEEELLLCCARVSMNSGTAERTRNLLRGKVKWGVLISAAQHHGLHPLLSWHLHSLFPELVPKDVLAELHQHFVANTARNFRLTAELLRILALFESQGIPAIPFKGPIAAISIYGNLALREFGDLDILVREESINKAEEILYSQGYRPQLHVPRAQLRLHFRTNCENAYIHEDGTRVIELHWRIAASCFPFAIDIERLWLKHEYVQLGDTKVRNFSPEDTLLILCAHGGKHLWDRLELICGVAEFIRVHQDMEWEQVLKRAQETKSRHILCLGLLLAHEILGAQLPEGILARIEKDSAVKKLAIKVRERLFDRDPSPVTRLEWCRFYRGLADRWWDGMLVLPSAAFIPSPADWDLVQLPRFLSPLYYSLRAFRLLKKYALRSDNS